MRCLGISIFLFFTAGAVFGQNGPTVQSSSSPTAARSANDTPSTTLERAGVPKSLGEGYTPSTAVVTIKGVCETPKQGADCKTVVTRAEIDLMMNLLEPGASVSARRQFATNYARLVADYGVAQKRHLDKDPAVAAAIRLQQKLVRMQVMANVLYQRMDNQAAVISPAEVDKYYAAHKANFEEGTISRVTIPKTSEGTALQSVDEAASRARAEAIRTRIASGEDINKVQIEVSKEAVTGTLIPPTKLANLRRSSLTEQEGKVFDLEPGAVGELVELPSTWVVLRLDAKQTLGLESVRHEIVSMLHRERIQKETQKATLESGAEFNLKLLGLPFAPLLFPPPEVTQLAGLAGVNGNPARQQAGRRISAPKRHMVTALPGGRQTSAEMK